MSDKKIPVKTVQNLSELPAAAFWCRPVADNDAALDEVEWYENKHAGRKVVAVWLWVQPVTQLLHAYLELELAQ